MTVRDVVVAHAMWSVANEPQIHYSQDSRLRMAALDHPRSLPLSTDCSAIWTLFYKWAGAPDPNGRNFDGYGFTGTQLGNLPEIELHEAQIGDLIVAGPGTGDHVYGIVRDAGTADPLCVSHGQERGPILVRHSVEVRAHRPPFRVLRGIVDNPVSIPPVHIPVPDQDPLQQEDDDVQTFTYVARGDALGDPVGAVYGLFSSGELRGVKRFADFEEIYARQLKATCIPRADGKQVDDGGSGFTRPVWVIANDVADALGVPAP